MNRIPTTSSSPFCGWILVIGLLVWVTGCNASSDQSELSNEAKRVLLDRTIAQRFGTRWDESAVQASRMDLPFVANKRWRQAPTFSPVELPEIHLANAVWGATGRDDAGNIYVGVSCHGSDLSSSALCKISPGSDQAINLGDAVSNLQRLGLSDDKTTQMKIHCKPVQADDGYVYFTSMDEHGEKEDGSKLPTYGSHLWRIAAEGE